MNVASRLESSGILGRIQVSEQVAQFLTKNDDEFEVECRGPIELRGKGRLTTYLVKTPFDSVDSDLSEPLYGTAESELAGASDELLSPPEVVADGEVEELCADG